MNNQEFHQRFSAISKALINKKVTVSQVYNIITKLDINSESKTNPDIYEILNKELNLGLDLKSIDTTTLKKEEQNKDSNKPEKSE